MKAFNRLLLWTLLLGLTFIAALNGYVSYRETGTPGKAYRIEINRIYEQVQRGIPLEELLPDLNRYSYVNGLSWIGKEAGPDEVQRFLPVSGWRTQVNSWSSPCMRTSKAQDT